MSIEAPLFLLALPVVLLPFLIRWIRPPRPLSVAFSQMRILDKVLRRTVPMRRINPWLLYLIRMLAALVLVLLPLGIYLAAAGRGSGRAAVLFLVDDTFHARTRTEAGSSLWDCYRGIVSTRLDGLPLASSAALLGWSGRRLEWRGPSELKKALGQMPPTYGREDWLGVKQGIRALRRSRSQSRMELVLVSSGRAGEPSGLEQALMQLSEEDRLEMVSVGEKLLGNYSLRARVLPRKGGALVAGDISPPAPGVAASAKLVLRSPSGQTAQQQFEISAGKAAPIYWEVAGEGFAQGVLSLDLQDGLELDNSHYFTAEAGRELRVMLLDQKSSRERLKDAGYYLREGLKVLEERGVLNLDERDPRDWRGLLGAPADVAVLHDPPFLSDEEAAALLSFANSGGDVVLVAGPETDPETMDKRLGQALPAALKEIQKTDCRLAPEGEWGRRCPRMMATPFRLRWLFYRLAPGARVILSFQDGVPFWICVPLGGGRVHLISTPFQLAWSDAVVVGDFPRFLQEMVSALSSPLRRGRGAIAIRMGEPFPRDFSSVRALMGPQPADLDEAGAAPGLYRCVLQDGAEVVLPCNFDPGVEEARSPIGEPRKKGGLSAPPSGRIRLDAACAVIFGLMLLAEAGYLLAKRSVPLS